MYLPYMQVDALHFTYKELLHLSLKIFFWFFFHDSVCLRVSLILDIVLVKKCARRHSRIHPLFSVTEITIIYGLHKRTSINCASTHSYAGGLCGDHHHHNIKVILINSNGKAVPTG